MPELEPGIIFILILHIIVGLLLQVFVIILTLLGTKIFYIIEKVINTKK